MLYLGLVEKEVWVWGAWSGVEGSGRYCLATRGSGTSGSGPLRGTRGPGLGAEGGGQLPCLSVGAAPLRGPSVSAVEGRACRFSGRAGGAPTEARGGEEP